MAFFGKSDIRKLATHAGLTIFNLNDRIYLFKPHSESNTCIISAHGGRQAKNGGTFRVPSDTILRFYAEDTFCVLDPGFSDFYKKEAVPREILSEGDLCHDYCLTKYQGRHNSADESYSLIAGTISKAFESRELATTQLQAASAKNAPAKIRKILGEVVARNRTPAVVTIRNRMLKADMTLSEVISLVRATSPEIMLFDCSFCRHAGGKAKGQDVALIDR